MQEWTIMKKIIIHKMYPLSVSFYLFSPETSWTHLVGSRLADNKQLLVVVTIIIITVKPA